MSLSILHVENDNIDVGIIEHINQQGLQYFLERYSKIIQEPSSSIEYTYFKSYLNIYFLEDIWSNNFELLIQNITPDTIHMLLTFIQEENQLFFWNKLLTMILSSNIDFNKLNYIYQIIIVHPKLLQLVPSLSIWEYSKTHDNFMGKLIDLSNDLNQINIFNIIMTFLKNKSTRSMMVKWFNQVYLENMERKNLSQNKLESLESRIGTDYWILRFCNLVLDTWFGGKNDHKIAKISLDFPQDIQSIIKWIDDPKETNNTYSYLNKCFFISHKIIEISVVNLIEELELEQRDLEYLEDVLANKESDQNFDTSNLIEIAMINGKIMLIKKRIEDIENILKKSRNLITKCSSFYNDTMYWFLRQHTNMNNATQPITDTILQNYTTFTKYVNNIKLDNISMKVAVKVMGNNNITKNPHIKTHFIKLFLDTIIHDIRTSVINYVSLEELNQSLIEAFNFIEDSVGDGFYDKYTPHHYICYIYKLLIKTKTDISYYIDTYRTINAHTFKKFINGLIGDLCYIAEESFENLRKLAIKQKDDSADPDECQQLQDKVKNLMIYLIEFLSMVSLMTQTNQDAFVETEIKDKFAGAINYLINEMIGDKRNELNIQDREKYNFQPLDILEQIKGILVNMSDYSIFRSCMAQDERYYKPRLISKMAGILSLRFKVTPTEERILKSLCCQISKIYLELQDEEDIVIPDEFCDPIMSSLIEEPVMLPDTDIIMDKSIISRHLLSDEHNPFNREKLTLQMLEDYNNLEDISKKISEFRDNLNKWKMSVYK